MTGCRHGAKNTLVKNYLHLAEQAGAKVFPLSTVAAVRPGARDGYLVETGRTGAWLHHRRRVFEADQVIFAAGALGTQRLLHRMRLSGQLPYLSPQIGVLTRTNSESILGASVPSRSARHRRLDLTDGVAITSSFQPRRENPRRAGPVRQGFQPHGHAADRPHRRRPASALAMARHHRLAPLTAARALSVRRWSERTVIALVMQSLDNSLTVSMRRSWYGRRRLVASMGHGAPNPSWIPPATERYGCSRGTRRCAGRVDQ
jgi:cholesterol oxidase